MCWVSEAEIKQVEFGPRIILASSFFILFQQILNFISATGGVKHRVFSKMPWIRKPEIEQVEFDARDQPAFENFGFG